MIEILMLLGAILMFLCNFLFLYYFLSKKLGRFIILVFTTFVGYFLNLFFWGSIFPFTEIIFLLFFGICLFLIFSARKFKQKHVIVFILSTIAIIFLLSLIPGKPCGYDYIRGDWDSCRCKGIKRTKFLVETECIGTRLACYKNGKIPVPCESLFNSDLND